MFMASGCRASGSRGPKRRADWRARPQVPPPLAKPPPARHPSPMLPHHGILLAVLVVLVGASAVGMALHGRLGERQKPRDSRPCPARHLHSGDFHRARPRPAAVRARSPPTTRSTTACGRSPARSPSSTSACASTARKRRRSGRACAPISPAPSPTPGATSRAPPASIRSIPTRRRASNGRRSAIS